MASPTKIRFHLDENVDVPVADALRRRGIDVTTTIDAGLVAANDESQLSYATAQGRVLVTHDSDLLALHSNGVPHAGICFCHKEKFSPGQLMHALLLVEACLQADEIVGQVEFL